MKVAMSFVTCNAPLEQTNLQLIYDRSYSRPCLFLILLDEEFTLDWILLSRTLHHHPLVHNPDPVLSCTVMRRWKHWLSKKYDATLSAGTPTAGWTPTLELETNMSFTSLETFLETHCIIIIIIKTWHPHFVFNLIQKHHMYVGFRFNW